MQAVREGGASRVAVQLVGGAGAGDRQRDAAGARDDPASCLCVVRERGCNAEVDFLFLASGEL